MAMESLNRIVWPLKKSGKRSREKQFIRSQGNKIYMAIEVVEMAVSGGLAIFLFIYLV